ncbi:LytR/AlgR family response regulator transcription factor [Pedobacter sp. AW31-3R]|uniref:LytR/AlgR family response regulator transcription factor n=1 Tax=Pedobacter sp. AW31-3R TaxID=3445781 RepID=UPI003FA183E0
MILKCVAIDDEPLALQLIETYAKRIPSLALVETFEDALTGVEYLNKHPVDLLFLDINMPDISGIDLAWAMKRKPMIIFTTAYRQFAYEGFQLEAIDYLLKPIAFDHFSNAFQKALSYKKMKDHPLPDQDEAFIYVHSEYRLLKVMLRDIEYIESMEDYIKIHTGTEKPVLTLMTLKKVLELLPEKQFMRIHRSYVIRLAEIKSIHQKKVQLKNVLLPVGDSYSEQLKLLI